MMQETNPRHSNVSPELDAAYRATIYVIRLPEREIRLGIDVPSPVLDAWLTKHSYTCWAFISAYNPRSQQLPPHENTARHAQLKQRLETLGLEHHTGVGQSETLDWPPEASWFVPGISLQDALALAREFDQIAIVYGAPSSAPRLEYTGIM